MRRLFVLGLLLALAMSAAPGADVRGATGDPLDYIDEAIDALETSWIGRYDMDWSAFVSSIWGVVTPASGFDVEVGDKESVALDPALVVESIVERLWYDCCDWHAAFYTAEEVARDTEARDRYVEGFRVGPPERDGFSPCGDIVEGDIAYIWIPGTSFSGASTLTQTYIRAKGEEVCRIVENLDRDAPQGWIIDLRQHDGGSYQAGCIGLHSFLPNGRLVGYAYPGYDGTLEADIWIEREGDRFYRTIEWGFSSNPRTLVFTLPVAEHILSRPEAPVAVLTSAATASAAEVLLVALRQNPNVRVFGEPTSGVSTVRDGYELPDGSLLLFSSGYLAAPDGHVYRDPSRTSWAGVRRLQDLPCVSGERIQPDVLAYVPQWSDVAHEVEEMQRLGPEAFLDTWYDPAYEAALAWIRDATRAVTPP
jgi:hypothetical protein